jgi:hypothetical protein
VGYRFKQVGERWLVEVSSPAEGGGVIVLVRDFGVRSELQQRLGEVETSTHSVAATSPTMSPGTPRCAREFVTGHHLTWHICDCGISAQASAGIRRQRQLARMFHEVGVNTA